MFSIDQFLSPPPLSLFYSILLIVGCDLIGVFLLQKLRFTFNRGSIWIRWQAPILGAMILAIILYPLALINLTSMFFMQLIAGFCMSLGVFRILLISRQIYIGTLKISRYWKKIREQTLLKKLLIFMLFGMGLVSLGPSTNADSLDYHLGFAIATLKNGGIPITPEWFSGRLSGNGEILNAMAISLGAEQFGSLLQYMSLLAVVGLILFARNTNIKSNNRNEHKSLDLIALAAFSAPVILFLVSSAKPQMWPIAMITFAFALIIHPSRRNLSSSNTLISYTLVCMLVMTASQSKFNYILDGGIVGIFAILLMAKQHYFWKSLAITFIVAALIMAPPIIWKAAVFNTNWINVLIHPLPGNLPGTDIFINNAIDSKLNIDVTSKFLFPFSVLIPDSIGSYGLMLGVGWLVFISFKPEKDLWLWSGILIATISLSIIILFAPISARLLLGPYFWLIFTLAMQPNKKLLRFYNWLKWPIFGQALLTSIAVWFGVLMLLPGALLPSWRTHIMKKFANGYEVMGWVDTTLPKNAILFNSHRSMALAPREAISSDWLGFVDTKTDESKIYLDKLKAAKVSHILIIGPLNYSAPLSNCYGKTLAGPGIGHLATRNPFNIGPPYEAWVLEFKSEKLPGCAN